MVSGLLLGAWRQLVPTGVGEGEGEGEEEGEVD